MICTKYIILAFFNTCIWKKSYNVFYLYIILIKTWPLQSVVNVGIWRKLQFSIATYWFCLRRKSNQYKKHELFLHAFHWTSTVTHIIVYCCLVAAKCAVKQYSQHLLFFSEIETWNNWWFCLYFTIPCHIIFQEKNLKLNRDLNHRLPDLY